MRVYGEHVLATTINATGCNTTQSTWLVDRGIVGWVGHFHC